MNEAPNDKENFQTFLEELSEVFKKSGLLVGLAAPASKFRIEDGYFPSKLNDLVDLVNVQAYDFHGDKDLVADHHSPLNARLEDEGLNVFLNAVSIFWSLTKLNCKFKKSTGLCSKVLVEKRTFQPKNHSGNTIFWEVVYFEIN